MGEAGVPRAPRVAGRRNAAARRLGRHRPRPEPRSPAGPARRGPGRLHRRPPLDLRRAAAAGHRRHR
ncbi:MAG: hypothetical protein ACK55I_46925, partial [bacterium]